METTTFELVWQWATFLYS